MRIEFEKRDVNLCSQTCAEINLTTFCPSVSHVFVCVAVCVAIGLPHSQETPSSKIAPCGAQSAMRGYYRSARRNVNDRKQYGDVEIVAAMGLRGPMHAIDVSFHGGVERAVGDSEPTSC